MITDKLLNEKVLIVGFDSITGRAVARFLKEKNISFAVSDTKSSIEVKKAIKKEQLNPFQVFSGVQSFNQLEGIDRIIIAPGVPRTIALLQEAIKRDIPVDSEVAYASYWIKNKNIRLIGITGTDGKSTTAALTHHILKAKFKTYLLGNFGEPLINQILNFHDGDVVVLELSSYQLEDAQKYRIHFATILNIAADHLNRYDSIDDYRMAKEKIFSGQKKEDWAIINKTSTFYEKWFKQCQGNVFTTALSGDADLKFDNTILLYNDKEFLNYEKVPLKGEHNQENILTASAFAILLGMDPAEIAKQVYSFSGLEHRCELLGNINGIQFINDSKATTVQAIIRALSCSGEEPVILIVGGRDKNLDFSELSPHLQQVKKVICYGEAASKIDKMLNSKKSICIGPFDKAVKKAIELASKKDTILLSPGCASFDQFSSYTERGKRFKDLVKTYEKETF